MTWDWKRGSFGTSTARAHIPLHYVYTLSTHIYQYVHTFFCRRLLSVERLVVWLVSPYYSNISHVRGRMCVCVSVWVWVRCVTLSVRWSLSLSFFPSSFLSSIGLHITHSHCEREREREYSLWQMLKLYLVLSRRMFGIVVHYDTYCCWCNFGVQARAFALFPHIPPNSAIVPCLLCVLCVIVYALVYYVYAIESRISRRSLMGTHYLYFIILYINLFDFILLLLLFLSLSWVWVCVCVCAPCACECVESNCIRCCCCRRRSRCHCHRRCFHRHCRSFISQCSSFHSTSRMKKQPHTAAKQKANIHNFVQ